MILRDLDAKSVLRVGLKITNHPPAPARKTKRGTLRKIKIVGRDKVVDQKENIRTHDVITTEARALRNMSLIDFKMFAAARRDKTAVTPR
jgi:hypothetical protein